MRLSRPCYDKPHRCPGWAGGGTKDAKVDRCRNGRVRTASGEHPGTEWWRVGRCNECQVVTWPYATRWLDFRWWRWVIGFRVRDLRYWWADR